MFDVMGYSEAQNVILSVPALTSLACVDRTYGLVVGTNWPDALVDSAVTGLVGGPFLLITGEDLQSVVRPAVVSLARIKPVSTSCVLGGVKSAP